MSETSKDALGDRMKLYEGMGGANIRLMPLLPVCVRIDGKNFSTFTKGLKRPFDQRFSDLMVLTTKFLVKETNARMGYTQSDEISLVLESDDYQSEIYFSSRLFKMLSILAAKTSVFFNRNLAAHLPEKAEQMPVFDCRVWTVPNRTEAVNTLIWREQDATRNSISMAAQSVYSHKELMGQSCDVMQEMLFQKGINWNDYPTFFKRGTYIQRQTNSIPFTTEELERLPAKHAARSNPDLKVERREIVALELPPLTRITNREEVVFDGARPILATQLNEFVADTKKGLEQYEKGEVVLVETRNNQ